MLLRSLKVHPSLLLALTIIGFFAWQISKGPGYESTIASQIIPSAGGLTEGLGIGGPKTPRIAMITFVTEQRSYIHTVLKNKNYYARRHGYDFIMDYEAHADRGAMFWKFEMVYRMIKTGKYDWIWWQDFDTLITNTATKVTDIIQEELANVTNPERIDFLLTHDCNGLNAGSFLVRAHERSTEFFHKVEALHDEARSNDKQISEQDAMVRLLAEDSVIAQSAHVVPQWKLNSFPDEIACYSEPKKPWVQGMFFLHFAGAWAHVKGDDPTGQLMDKYGGQILWGDWKEAF